jgi:isopenicillin N synthase-like dioxygenase
VRGAYEAAQQFFALPLDEKLRVRRPRPEQNRGYIPNGEETLARFTGAEAPPDLKEIFAIGPDAVPDAPYYTCKAAYPSFAPNLWPERPAQFQQAILDYWAALQTLSRTTARIFARALELPETWFDRYLDRDISMLRAIQYPEPKGPALPGQLRAGAHSDLNMVTFIRNEASAGGLQVRRRDGEWVEAPSLPGSFVVNLGDLMMRWTNDRWASTPHRVAMPPEGRAKGSDRLSLIFFLTPNYDASIECIPSCTGPGDPPKYAPITTAEYRTARFARAQGLGPDRRAVAGP